MVSASVRSSLPESEKYASTKLREKDALSDLILRAQATAAPRSDRLTHARHDRRRTPHAARPRATAFRRPPWTASSVQTAPLDSLLPQRRAP